MLIHLVLQREYEWYCLTLDSLRVFGFDCECVGGSIELNRMGDYKRRWTRHLLDFNVPVRRIIELNEELIESNRLYFRDGSAEYFYSSQSERIVSGSRDIAELYSI